MLVSLSLSLSLLLVCMAVLWGWIECVGRGVDAHFDIADVCFAGVFRPLNSGAFMVYFSDFGDVANVVEFCFAGSFVSINDGFPMV